MKLSLFIGRFFDIKVFVHWTFLIFLVWIVFSNLDNGWANIFWQLAFILGVFFCVTLHEFGHALTARRFDIKTRDVTLYPIGGVASLEKMPEKPLQELVVALAGPAVNVVIALLLYPFVKDVDIFNDSPVSKEYNALTIVPALFAVNIYLPLFNMIPAFPMDGGRVFRALLSMMMSRLSATRIAAVVGKAFAVLMMLAGLRGDSFLFIIGLFVYSTADKETQLVKEQELLKEGNSS